jgi:RNA polymerase sigma-70 factor, ECF subfamily
LPERLESVLQVIYLLFNEGYAATDGPDLTRPDLSNEALRLGRLLIELLPDAEALGLLALMMLHEARRQTRTDAAGDLVLLENQDRTLWNRCLIAEARGLIETAFATRRIGPYVLQAAIAAIHTEAPTFVATDWQRIVSLYELLERVDRSPVVSLNRAAAQAMRDGPAAGLAALEAVMRGGALDAYGPAHAARADMLRRLNRRHEAADVYRRALELTRQPAERRFLEGRLAELLG